MFSKEQAVTYLHFLQISLIILYADSHALLIHVRKKHSLFTSNVRPHPMKLNSIAVYQVYVCTPL